jgi:hypothetical protein
MLLRPMNLLTYLAAAIRELGPYAVAVALLVPGGFLIALAYWVFRHRGWVTASMTAHSDSSRSSRRRPYPSGVDVAPTLSGTRNR